MAATNIENIHNKIGLHVRAPCMHQKKKNISLNFRDLEASKLDSDAGGRSDGPKSDGRTVPKSGRTGGRT